MKTIYTFLKKPRNMYFSIIVMFTLVVGLFSISFSYYVDETSNPGIIKYEGIDNRINCEDLDEEGYITLDAHETRDIKLYVLSNNSYDTLFKLYYKTDGDAKVLSENELMETIKPDEAILNNLLVSNFSDEEVKVFIGIKSAYVNDEVNITDGEEIEIAE